MKEYLAGVSVLVLFMLIVIILFVIEINERGEYIEKNGCVKTSEQILENTFLPVVSSNGVTSIVPTVRTKTKWQCKNGQDIWLGE